jgi:hypothetical protein
MSEKINIMRENISSFISMMLILLAFLLTSHTYAQQPFPPPLQLQVFTIQGLGFGSFFAGVTGGTIQINPSGGRTTTGTVIGLPADPGMQAIFNVRLIPGRLVHINLSTSATLRRSGGSESLTVTNFTTDKPGNMFVTRGGQPFINPVQIGATLNVGNISANPAGEYSGNFNVTFIQE